MAGYYGYKMSNNAVEAYNYGEMPISKWTKYDIMAAAKECGATEEQVKTLNKYKVKTLKENVLKKSSWHHTSSFYNNTDFYSFDSEILDGDLNFEEAAAEEKEKPKKAHCKWIEWSGSRKHPKPNLCEGDGMIDGNTFTADDGTVKRITGNGFEIVKIY